MTRRATEARARVAAVWAIACIAFLVLRIGLALATSIDVRGPAGSGTTTVSELNSAKGVTLNGSSGVTVTGPILISLASTLIFDTIQSNAAQPITLTPASGSVNISAGSQLQVNTINAISGAALTLSAGGTGLVIVSAGNTLRSDAIASTSINTSITMAPRTSSASVVSQAAALAVADVSGAHPTFFQASAGRLRIITEIGGFVQIDPNDSLAASLANITTLNVTQASASEFAGPNADITTINATTSAVTNATSTNTTATNVWTNRIGPRTVGAIQFADTQGVTITTDDGSAGSAWNFTPGFNLTLNGPSGAPLLFINAGLQVGTNLSVSGTSTFTGNTTVAGIFFSNSWRPFSAGGVVSVNAARLDITDAVGGNVSSFTPGTKLQLASGMDYAGDKADITTINVTTAQNVQNLVADASTGLAVKGNGNGIDLRSTTGTSMSLDAGTSSSTWNAAANKLTLNVNGTGGVFQIDTADSFAGALANLTTLNVTTVQNATTISGTNHNGTHANMGGDSNLTTLNVTTEVFQSGAATNNVSLTAQASGTLNVSGSLSITANFNANSLSAPGTSNLTTLNVTTLQNASEIAGTRADVTTVACTTTVYGGAAAYSATEGSVSYNSVSHSHALVDTSTTVTISGTLFNSTTDSNSVSDTTALTAFTPTYTLPANFLRVGRALRITAEGTMDAGTDAAQGIGAQITFDGVAANDFTNSLYASTGTQTNGSWVCRANIICRTEGAGGTVQSGGEFLAGFGQVLGNTAVHYMNNGVSFVSHGTMALDTTVSHVIDVRWKFEKNTAASETAKMRLLMIEAL